MSDENDQKTAVLPSFSQTRIKKVVMWLVQVPAGACLSQLWIYIIEPGP